MSLLVILLILFLIFGGGGCDYHAWGGAARRRAMTGTHHLQVRGDGHSVSKAVITPKGRFGSAALAAEAHGISAVASDQGVSLGRLALHFLKALSRPPSLSGGRPF